MRILNDSECDAFAVPQTPDSAQGSASDNNIGEVRENSFDGIDWPDRLQSVNLFHSRNMDHRLSENQEFPSEPDRFFHIGIRH